MPNRWLVLGLLAILGLSSACALHPEKPSKSTDSSGLSRILAKGELVVGITGKQPPFNMKSKEGRIVGMDADLAQRMALAMGVTLTLKAMDFFELLPALESGQIDMVLSGMTITPERNLKSAFVGPYFVTGKSLLTKADHIVQCQDLCDIDSPQVTVTALKGSTSQHLAEKLLPKAKLIPAKDYDEAVRFIIEEKADALIADQFACLLAVIRYPGQGLRTSLKTFAPEPLGIALLAADPLLLNWVENFIKVLQANGELKKLAEYWINKELSEQGGSGVKPTF